MSTKTEKRQRISFMTLEGLPPLAIRFLRSAKLFRSLAAQARRKDDWTADAFFRRKACEIEPRRGENWIQLGHSLKELGFYNKAADSYLKSLDILPESSEIHIHLAHLFKMQGDFKSSTYHFLEARRLNYPDDQQIDREIALLSAIDNTIIYPGIDANINRSGVKIYLSAPVPSIIESNTEALSKDLGKSDYSYGFAMRGFVRALDNLGYSYTVIQNPEFISDIRQRSNAEINIHLGFYPPERLRILKGAYNVNCFAWEFDRLRSSSEVLSYHAFSDQATMLEMVDEVWIPSTHGAQAVARSVAKPVYTVPAPVLGDLRASGRDGAPSADRVKHLAQSINQVFWQPMAIFARLQQSMNEEASKKTTNLSGILRTFPDNKKAAIFLTILNVHDFRKQLYPMLLGFLDFQTRHKNALMLVKMTTPDRGKLPINTFLLMDQVLNAGELPRPLVSDHVWITDEILSREDMNRLYDLADFYVCTSYAEGQNLPLLEAMGRGVVPVSVNNTAMADYINDETAVPILSEPRPFGPRLASRYGIYGLETNFVEAADVRHALERAVSLSSRDYTTRSAAALATVESSYSAKPIDEALKRVVSTIQRSKKDA